MPHDLYMHHCLQLARLGAGYVAPNPMVGAVLVHQGRIIGEGYHRRYGQAHAEVNCLDAVSAADRHLIPESTLYVSLEPCAHQGKTPPCTGLILRHRIPRVVIGCRDSFTEVNGKGIAQLQAAGVEVITGVLEKEARELNRRFFTYHEQQRPYVLLKWAESRNGCIAAQGSRPVAISNPLTNRIVHRWRGEEAAILVGTGTALQDNPRLTTRLWPGAQPLRVLIDRELRVPLTHHLLSDGLPTLVINARREERAGAVEYVRTPSGQFGPADFLQLLFERKLQSVLVEGGARLQQAFIDAGYWDEARVITAGNCILPEGIPAARLSGAQVRREDLILQDCITTYYPAHS